MKNQCRVKPGKFWRKEECTKVRKSWPYYVQLYLCF